MSQLPKDEDLISCIVSGIKFKFDPTPFVGDKFVRAKYVWDKKRYSVRVLYSGHMTLKDIAEKIMQMIKADNEEYK